MDDTIALDGFISAGLQPGEDELPDDSDNAAGTYVIG